jgi:hypothetical protein
MMLFGACLMLYQSHQRASMSGSLRLGFVGVGLICFAIAHFWPPTHLERQRRLRFDLWMFNKAKALGCTPRTMDIIEERIDEDWRGLYGKGIPAMPKLKLVRKADGKEN